MLNWNNLLTALAETTATTGTTDAATQTGGMISTWSSSFVSICTSQLTAGTTPGENRSHSFST